MTPTTKQITTLRERIKKPKGEARALAASLIGRTQSAWESWEYGRRTMSQAEFELATIKIDQL